MTRGVAGSPRSRMIPSMSSMAWASPLTFLNPIIPEAPFRVWAMRKISLISSEELGFSSRDSSRLLRVPTCSWLSSMKKPRTCDLSKLSATARSSVLLLHLR